jgi:(4-(4-[2-(gamma-L-glutamylamino)ethyl]phenoxymethyl)furan-2-yl)methanamine synthase
MSSSMPDRPLVLGWDVGGAHLKAALLNADGMALRVVQVACPLWQGLDRLSAAVHQILDQLPAYPQQHVVTMTGELADIFPDRLSGVMQIADVLSQQLIGKLSFYAGRQGFIALADVSFYANDVASANWLASAEFVARRVEHGVFVDIGSTTADIVSLVSSKPAPRGYSDAARMRAGELVYTGVVRTPLMAVAPRICFGGEYYGLAAEHFATTADVYRLTGDLDEAHDMAATADGAGKTPADSARRLARMIGHDLADAEAEAWLLLAHAFKHAQLNTLREALLRSASLHPQTGFGVMVGAGAGRFLVAELAAQLHRKYTEVQTLIQAADEDVQRWAAICLPAYAVAYLAVQHA